MTTQADIEAVLLSPEMIAAVGEFMKARAAEAKKAQDIAVSDAFLAGAQWALNQGHTHGPQLSSVLRDPSGNITGMLRENVTP